MNTNYRIIIVLRGGQFMNLIARNKEELLHTTSMLDDMILRIFNRKEKDDSAPFLNCKPVDTGGYAWVDVREMSGYYVVEPTQESSLDDELKKRSIELQERFIKLMEEEHNKGDEWKKKEGE